MYHPSILVFLIIGSAVNFAESTNKSQRTEVKMAEKMLADMGLTKRPDLTHANISVEEYGLMYKVYQKSVRQTETLRELRKAMKKPDEDKKQPIVEEAFAIKPSDADQSGRHRRSGIRAFANPKGLHAVVLKFSHHDLLGPRKDKANALHIVNTATLALKVKSQAKYSQPPTTVTFTMYQLMEEAEMRPEAAIAMETFSLHIEEADLHDLEVIEFDATEMVQTWLIDEDSNHGIRIECDLCHQVGLQFTNEDINLAMKIHSTDNQMAMTRRSSLEPHLAVKASNHECEDSPHKKRPRCCRESMKVDLSSIPGFEFIQQPRSFDAFLCKGRCPPRFNAANDHSLLQSLMHLRTKNRDLPHSAKIPRPCCVGTKFEPLDILHVDDNDPSKLKVTHWKNVIVSECGCL